MLSLSKHWAGFFNGLQDRSRPQFRSERARPQYRWSRLSTPTSVAPPLASASSNPQSTYATKPNARRYAKSKRVRSRRFLKKDSDASRRAQASGKETMKSETRSALAETRQSIGRGSFDSAAGRLRHPTV